MLSRPARAHGAGVDLDEITRTLEIEGVESFLHSYQELTDCIAAKLKQLDPTGR